MEDLKSYGWFCIYVYSLPPDLVRRHDSIMERFDQISGDWKKDQDEIIPEDVEFAKEILLFIIDALTFYEKNYETTKQVFWSEFAYSFPASFYYGPQGDDYNYLDFDEQSVFDLFLGLWDNDDLEKLLDLNEFKQVKKKFIEAYKKF